MSTGLNFFQARALSQGSNLHVRRESWSDTNQWFICWRGLWWYFTTGIMRPVQAVDYTSAELLAADWTSVPAALAACPLDPTIGSTGGNPPNPSFGVTASAGGSPFGGGGGGNPGAGSINSTLPSTPDGKSLTITFAGMGGGGFGSDNYTGINTNQPVPCKFGGGIFTGTFQSGTRNSDGSTINWTVTVEAFPSGDFSIGMSADHGGDPDGGFFGIGTAAYTVNRIGFPAVVNGGSASISI